MLTESIGGLCPNCGNTHNDLRYGSEGYYRYFACPKCGFAYGENGEVESWHSEVWETIEGMMSHMLGKLMTRKDVNEHIENLSREPNFQEDLKGITPYEFTKEELENFRMLNLPVYG